MPELTPETLAQDAAAPEQAQVVNRERPEPEEARRQLVSLWTKRVVSAKQHWEKDFNRMRANQRFARGFQWPDEAWEDGKQPYVNNVTLRHIQQRTAAIYAKNPKVVARLRERLYSSVWDGTQSALTRAQQYLTAVMTGMMPPEPQMVGYSQTIVQEAQQARMIRDQLKRVGRTLELLYGYQISEQIRPFKSSMKSQVVRRALTTGVGYVKVGFQRAMARRPEVERQMADVRGQLDKIERLSADIADEEVQPDTAQAETLRLMLRHLEEQEQVLVREGLVFDYPNSTALIPDPNCTYLRDFVGADWVTEEYILSPAKVQEIYGVDVSSTATRYIPSDPDDKDGAWTSYFRQTMGDRDAANEANEDAREDGRVLVWEIYCKADGLVYVVCDGHPDFLVEPSEPDVWLERFWPWYVFAPNEVDDDGNRIFPPSDVDLMQDPQLDINRARQGLREHRIAGRPKIAVPSGILSEEDREKLQKCPAFAVIEMGGLQPGQKVGDLLQDFRGSPIDPNLYETNSAFEDVLRAVGTQEANIGGTAGATATESSIAESARLSSVEAMIDELDDLLTHMARAGGQIMLNEFQEETVRRLIGPGAVWPQMDREQVAEELYLEIEAGSTGRPNKAQEIQNFERIAPLLMQMPGVSPEFLAREALRRMDDRLSLEDAFAEGQPSIAALNAQTGIPGQGAAAGPNDPSQQGAEGANNAPAPPGRPPGGPPNPEQARAAAPQEVH